jgi:hypothetical protein
MDNEHWLAAKLLVEKGADIRPALTVRAQPSLRQRRFPRPLVTPSLLRTLL